MEQVYRDIKFLAGHELMDYSLLVIIENNPKWVELQMKRYKRQKEEQTMASLLGNSEFQFIELESAQDSMENNTSRCADSKRSDLSDLKRFSMIKRGRSMSKKSKLETLVNYF